MGYGRGLNTMKLGGNQFIEEDPFSAKGRREKKKKLG